MGTSISLTGSRILKLHSKPGAWLWEVFWAPTKLYDQSVCMYVYRYDPESHSDNLP